MEQQLPSGIKLRRFDDIETQKKWIDDRIINAFKNKEYEGKKVTLKITNPRILPREFSLQDQKEALLARRSLSRPVRATVTLYDNETGAKLDEVKDKTIAQAPYHTGRGTVISNGSYYAVANQLKLRPGAYTRKKSNGEIETHFNLISGTGSGFRVGIDPKTGVFNFNLKSKNVGLYPLIKAMGANDNDLERAWGSEILDINRSKSKGDADLTKLYTTLVPYGNPDVDSAVKVSKIIDTLSEAKMDPEVNNITLKKPYDSVKADTILDATKKIINIRKGLEDTDERDSLQFKSLTSVEDMYYDKVTKDAGGLGKNLVMRLDRQPTLTKLPNSYFSKQLWGVIKNDPAVSPTGTLSQPIEEINPIDLYDQHHKVTITGEGGITNQNEISEEARNVHPSQFGFIDFIRTPESKNVGIDQRIADGVYKGSDRRLYRQFINAKNKRKEWLNPLHASLKVRAFPKEMDKKTNSVVALDGNNIDWVNKKKVEYYLDKATDLFSTYGNLAVMPPSIQGNRMILASKGLSTALPLVNGEAPFVRSKNPNTGKSFDHDYGRKIVSQSAKVDGVVTKVDKANIYIKDNSGKVVRHGLYNDYPLNLKTSINSKPKVEKGDKVKQGDLIATSNFTNDKGILSSGINLKSAYVPYKGWNFEDGIVISDTASKKLSSEQTYTYEYRIDDKDNEFINKKKFTNLFPTTYEKNKLDMFDDTGVIKKGVKVKLDDPLILAAQKKPPSARDIELGNLHKNLKNIYRDVSQTWNHHGEGEVVNVFSNNKIARVQVKVETPAKVGDKLTGRFGNKGVVSLVLPDEKMPFEKETGEKFDILLNPVGIPTRINPAQNHEAVLGKIVKKTGKPYILEHFSQEDLIKFVEDEAKKHKVKPESTLVVPEDGDREVPNVLTGQSYILKLSKLSEGEIKSRNQGGYDLDQQPVKGKGEGAQALRLGNMEINSLLGHGAKNFLREKSTIGGQQNPDFWRAMKLGYPLPQPSVPFVYNKFINMLEGAGVNVKKEGDNLHLMPLTDKDILRKSSGPIEKSDIVYSKNLQPVRGGLFDPAITGGTLGQKWSHIPLTEPLPNPTMEEPIKNLLGINAKELSNLIRNNTLKNELKKIDITEEIKNAKDVIKSGQKSKRDSAIKRLSYLNTMEANDIKPTELMLNNVPVLPPVFRPLSVVGSKGTISPGNANLLYKDLMVSNKVLKDLKPELPDSELGSERENNYKALKAVVGLGDPINIKNKSKGVKGFIREITGDQPKTGFFQRKVLSKTQDNVGRAVATPDPSLNIDQISLPEDMAWKAYAPFVMRRMITNGYGKNTVEIAEEIQNRTPNATKFLIEEMRDRPAIANRNPSLHKYNVMAFEALLNKDNVIKTSPPVASGFNLDHDGDQVNIHIPATPEAVKEAKDLLMPSKNLFHIRDRKIHYLPVQGSIMGLYGSSKPAADKGVKKVFNSIEELNKALKEGSVSARDVVEVNV